MSALSEATAKRRELIAELAADLAGAADNDPELGLMFANRQEDLAEYLTDALIDGEWVTGTPAEPRPARPAIDPAFIAALLGGQFVGGVEGIRLGPFGLEAFTEVAGYRMRILNNERDPTARPPAHYATQARIALESAAASDRHHTETRADLVAAAAFTLLAIERLLGK